MNHNKTNNINTLYKVWGIIIFVFAGFYGVFNGLILILGIFASSIGGLLSSFFSRGLSSHIGSGTGIIFLLLLSTAIGLTIRILAGIYLVRPIIKSKIPLIVVGVIYFLMAILNVFQLILFIVGGSRTLFFILFSFFSIAFNATTGFLLLYKQSEGALLKVSTGMPRAGVPKTPSYPGNSAVRNYNYPTYKSEGRIEGLFGSYKDQNYILRSGEICKIGRESNCEIQLHHPMISRIHCVIKLLPNGKFEITDYSRNGTYYNNQSLTYNETTVVNAGGMLAVGSADNVFQLSFRQL